MNRKLWLDKRGMPVITTTPNGERNAIRWGWTPATARPLPAREAVARTLDQAGALEKRTAEARQLQQALTRKNARLRRYKDDLRRASEKRKEAYRAGRRAERRAQAGKPHVYICKIYSGWVITINCGARSYIYFKQPTHAEAMRWAENKLKELAND